MGWSDCQNKFPDKSLDFDKLDPAVKQALMSAPEDAQQLMKWKMPTLGQRSAVIYTVIESCRRRGLDPYAQLREVLTRLPNMTNRQIPEVVPAVWGKIQRPLQVQLAS